MQRRDLLKAALVIGGLGPRLLAQPSRTQADYVVVGSGAGGGTVAARLAEAGYSVIVLEAGDDPRQGAPDEYDVPAFHPFATESAAMRWDFYVRHYADQKRQTRDPKFVPDQDAVWYPRAGTLGGCTAHNAMILAYPCNADWDQLADLTGDPSWRADAMWSYFQRVENCHHRPLERAFHAVVDPTRHGWSGWLTTENPALEHLVPDAQMRAILAKAVDQVLRETGAPSLARLEALFDPNDWRSVKIDEVGARYTPLSTDNHRRTGTRERLLSVQQRYPDRLHVELNALATRVLFDSRNRAIGVEYQKGARLYAAHPDQSHAAVETRVASAGREVILAGGAFNTPQLLMLSGIGDRTALAKLGIASRVDLPGVGRNLQDRYEVAVVNRTQKPWEVLNGATFSRNDPQYRRWAAERTGVYTSNGSLLCVVQRSTAGIPVPDLFCYGLLADFRGYRPGYSDAIRMHHDRLTWVVLKGHTNNRGGAVTLASPDPRARPLVNFNYFDEGTDAGGEDLQALVEGIKLVRRITGGLRPAIVAEELLPGDHISSDDDLKTFARDHAWGHHASCSCPIGDPRRGGVLGSDFRVHGTAGLRVVDASVFPRIPGLFIVSAIYMVGEKAADAIVADATSTRKPT
jgi:choline dehydrogenase-like flavoprotein